MAAKKKGFNKKEMAEIAKQREEVNNEILGMELDDFKKIVVKSIDALEDCIHETVNWNAEQRDMMVDGLAKGFKSVRKDLKMTETNFKAVGETISSLAHFVFVMAVQVLTHIEGEPLTDERKKALADCAGIDWGDMKKHMTRHMSKNAA